MVSTRATSKKAASPQVGDRRRNRFLKELHIDGTSALRCGEREPQVGRVQKWKGASYVVEDDGISWARTGSKRRAEDVETASPPAAKRLRRSGRAREGGRNDTISMVSSKKRKREEDVFALDADFLAETIAQLQRTKVPKISSRHAEIRGMMPYLSNLKPVDAGRIRRHAPVPGRDGGDAAPETYELDEKEAKRFFRSNEHIDAPVFLSGSSISLVDPEIDARPVQQVLDWLADLEESFTFADVKKPLEGTSVPQTRAKVSEIRERFLDNQENPAFPWNFPEIPLPTVSEGLPAYLQHPSCNFLRDIVRYVQNIEINDICQETCQNHGHTAEKCPVHFINLEEMMQFQDSLKQWLGTIMLAEAGALTQAHYDGMGFGTLISCHEGEIGFAWCVNARAGRVAEATDQWRFRVLRPGDAVFMGPGTWHLVFRLPSGQQTLASSVRILRYQDIEEWLKSLSVEIQGHIDDAELDDQLLAARCLTLGARHLINQAVRQQNWQKFGGKAVIDAAKKLLSKIDRQLQELF